ncbi:hypothetical protein BKA63DRAFT_487599 [Paraphoma chrysanthemicola]|nr:hypothetical protein BKA63DRAFT_487599 [Paraphoma chrysanthemicola]
MTIDTTKIGRFDGKVILITGGSSGIGLAVAQQFTSKGATVVIGDLQAPISSNERFEAQSHFVKTDVTSWDSQLSLFKKTLELYGTIDIVVVNAGISENEQAFEDRTDSASGDPIEPMWSTLKVNLLGALISTKLSLHFLRKSFSGGAIVIVGSRACYDGFGMPVYTSTKHGVLGLVRSLKHFTPDWNIRLNVVAPGVTFTPLLPDTTQKIYKERGYYMQTPDDAAKAVLFLAQEQSYNGKVISISGGKYRELEGPLAEVKESIYGAEDFGLKDEEEGKAILSACVTRF